MNNAQSTIVGLKAQDCPGGGWNGMPAELEDRATVADCLANGVCGCIYGDAVQHIERLRMFLREIAAMGPADEEWDADTLESAVALAKKALGKQQITPEK